MLKLTNPKLIDRYNRKLTYLRLSITDRCNLRCLYCVPRELIPRLSHDEILRYEEVLRLVKIGAKLGVSKVRVTGGEPLIRKGVYSFLRRLSQIEGLVDVTLTTNGILLKKNLEKIQAAGVKRINISLDTLSPQKFAQITGFDKFHQVWEGIELAHQMGFNPIKLNAVALNGINDEELIDLARLSFSYPFHIRFIEQMPIGDTCAEKRPPLLVPAIKQRVSALGELIPVKSRTNDGPAERFKFKGAQGEVGFISALSHHFCDKCNRMRLTASGQLRPCLLSDHQVDLKGPLRKGFSDTQLAELFLKVASAKPFEHHLSLHDLQRVTGQMSSIGG